MAATRSARRKIIRIQKTHFNLGTVIFFVLLIYMIFNTVNYLQKEHISIYEVTQKKMSDDNSTLGFAIRTEDIYQSNTSGTIAYYTSKGNKVANKSTLFSVDATGAYSEFVASIDPKDTTDEREIENIRNIISNYRNNYSNASYGEVSNFKYSIESAMMSSISDEIIQEYQKNIPADGKSFNTVISTASGIISYWFDGYEDVTKDTISSKYFDISDDYKKNNLKSSDEVSSGENVCKVATSEQWSIIVKLDEKQYKKLEDKKYIGLRFCEDNFETTVPFELFTKDGDYFASLNFKNYLSRYIDERYIKIELNIDSVEGLKIPKSSLIEKNCYLVPKAYISKAGENNHEVLTYRNLNDKNQKLEELDSFCMTDDEYVYIDTASVQPGTMFINPNNQEEYQVGEMKTFTGVYNVNKGYCQFKNIEILYENQEYCIINKDTPYGLSVYDHIVINPELINENDIIY